MLRGLKLKNYKCFKDIELDFSPLTVLTGLNSTGKSSIIHSILLLRQSMIDGKLTADTKLSLNGNYINLGDGFDLLYEFADSDDISMEYQFDSLTYGNSWNVSNKERKLSPRRLDLSESKTYQDNDIFSRTGNGYLDFVYLSADRIVPELTYKLSAQKPQNGFDLGSRGEFSVEYFDYIANKQIPIPEISQSRDLQVGTIQQNIECWLNVISPGVRIKTEMQQNIDLVRLSYEYSRPGHRSRNYSPVNVGFGITYIFPVLLSIIAANKGAMLLIENPEVHLHPRGQTELGKLMGLAAQNGVQIILETHSDHIINGIRLAVKNGDVDKDNVILHFFENSVTIPCCVDTVIKLNDAGKLVECPDNFLSEWEMSLSQLI